MAYSLFWGLRFLKTFPIIAIQSPRSSDAVRRIFWKKTLLMLISIFVPLIMADAEMAVVSNGGRRGRLLLALVAGYCYGE